jgi:sugar phosphate isomerase/epimerase
MKLGIDSYSTRNSGLDPVGVLELAAQWGLQGVLFELSPFRSFADDCLARIRQTGQSRGLFLHFGMGSIFHWHPMAAQGRELLAAAGYDVNVSEARIVIHHLEVARKLGSPILRCVAGNLFTRDEGHDMTALADRAVAILGEACRAAEGMGMKIALENHADFTVREMASIYARVNSPALGFTVDTANLAFDLDDPLRLAGILAPHALTTHFKNYRILRTKTGLALENVWLGDGDIDVAAIARLLAAHNPQIHLNIEIHSQFAPFKLNILEDGYFTRHPSPPGDGLAWYLGKSLERPFPEREPANLADGPASWDLERDHIERSIRWLKENLG